MSGGPGIGLRTWDLSVPASPGREGSQAWKASNIIIAKGDAVGNPTKPATQLGGVNRRVLNGLNFASRIVS